MRVTLMAVLLGACLLTPQTSFAQDVEGTLPVADVHLGTVLVHGKQPGPRLWKVTNGENTLWIIGTLSPLPAGMEWDAARVERLVASSQQVIWSPSLSVGADINIFKGIYLGYQFKRSEGNPDGKTLKDVLPASTYNDWLIQKKRFLGNDRSIENKRPMFAAGKLYEAALKRSGLKSGAVVETPIRNAAKANKVAITAPTYKIMVKDPGKLVKQLRGSSLNDVACMQATLELLEQRLPRVAPNANAWATGNLSAISLGSVSHRAEQCSDALSESELGKQLGVGDINAHMRNAWVNMASDALKKNRSTVALLSIQNLTNADGYLAALRAKGYTVIAPQ